MLTYSWNGVARLWTADAVCSNNPCNLIQTKIHGLSLYNWWKATSDQLFVELLKKALKLEWIFTFAGSSAGASTVDRFPSPEAG